MNISFTTTAEQDAALTAIVNNVNNSRPLDEQGNPIGAAVTEENYILNRIRDVLNSYVNQQVLVEAESVKETFIKASVADRTVIKDAVSPISTKVIDVGEIGIIK